MTNAGDNSSLGNCSAASLVQNVNTHTHADTHSEGTEEALDSVYIHKLHTCASYSVISVQSVEKSAWE